MKKEHNGMALSGFLVSLISLPLLAAGFLCLIGVWLTPLVAVVFGEAAGLFALLGIVLSAIGQYRSYGDNVSGACMSVTGLLVGVMVLTLVLSLTALWIATCSMGMTLFPMPL